MNKETFDGPINEYYEVRIGDSTKTEPQFTGQVYQLVNRKTGLVEFESTVIAKTIGAGLAFTEELNEYIKFLDEGAPVSMYLPQHMAPEAKQ